MKKVVETLHARYGEFALAMLYTTDLEADSSWNFIVSAPWTDAKGVGEATRIVAHALNQGLDLENQRAISRITVLKTSDPFVQDITKHHSATPVHPISIQQVMAGPISEGSGFILYSQMVA
jgi:hypothetical protein